jgi:hypothetical protein
MCRNASSLIPSSACLFAAPIGRGSGKRKGQPCGGEPRQKPIEALALGEVLPEWPADS